jgi:hypothetical protein
LVTLGGEDAFVSEQVNDSRPILFRRDRSNPNVISVLGGKVDNIFDLEELLGDAHRSMA